MEIFLLRHGIAAKRDPKKFANDELRPLTAKGKKQLLKTASAMKKMKLRFDLILSSPLVRAKQTAQIIATELKLAKRLKFSGSLKPVGIFEKLSAELNRQKIAPAKILLIGHEPDLSRLVSLLTTGDLHLHMDLKKGGLAKLETEKLAAKKCAALVWLLTPKQMKLMT